MNFVSFEKYKKQEFKKEIEMTNKDPMSLPLPAYAGGTKAITLTPIRTISQSRF